MPVDSHRCPEMPLDRLEAGGVNELFVAVLADESFTERLAAT